MTISKSDFFSIELKKEVIDQQCLFLFKFFLDHNKNKAIRNFLPKINDKKRLNKNIIMYCSDNKEEYSIFLDEIKKDMGAQNETLSHINTVEEKKYKDKTIYALNMLEKKDLSLAYALNKFVSKVLIVGCDDLIACSSLRFLGIIVLAPKKNWTLIDYMENLIHEMSHIDLYIKQLVDPLVHKGELLSSPFRTIKRPVNGVFHAAFVLARIIYFLTPHSKVLYGLDFRLDECKKQLTSTINELDKKRVTTEMGQILLSNMSTVLHRRV